MQPCLLVLLLTTLAVAQNRNPHTGPADVAAGAKIYRSHGADCHGTNGRGGKGPDLTSGQYFNGSSDAALLKNITDGIEGTAIPGPFCCADQVWQVVAFICTLAVKDSALAPPGDAVAGARLFRAKGCFQSHLVEVEDGVNAPDLSFLGSQRRRGTSESRSGAQMRTSIRRTGGPRS